MTVPIIPCQCPDNCGTCKSDNLEYLATPVHIHLHQEMDSFNSYYKTAPVRPIPRGNSYSNESPSY